MKKLLNVLVLVLAMNFLAVAGGVGWLWQTGPAGSRKSHGDQGNPVPQTGGRCRLRHSRRKNPRPAAHAT